MGQQAGMFDQLTTAERSTLHGRLESAARQFAGEWDALRAAPPRVLACYGIGPGAAALPSDWLEASVECARLAREIPA